MTVSQQVIDNSNGLTPDTSSSSSSTPVRALANTCPFKSFTCSEIHWKWVENLQQLEGYNFPALHRVRFLKILVAKAGNWVS